MKRIVLCCHVVNPYSPQRAQDREWAEFKASLGRLIRRTRRAEGLSLEAVKQKSGVPVLVIQRIEVGQTIPRIDTLLKILQALHVGLMLDPADRPRRK